MYINPTKSFIFSEDSKLPATTNGGIHGEVSSFEGRISEVQRWQKEAQTEVPRRHGAKQGVETLGDKKTHEV